MKIESFKRMIPFKNESGAVCLLKISLPIIREEANGEAEEKFKKLFCDFFRRLSEKYTERANEISLKRSGGKRPLLLSVSYEIGDESMLDKKKRKRIKGEVLVVKRKIKISSDEYERENTEIDIFLVKEGRMLG